MNIVGLETVRIGRQPNLLFVLVHTSDGHVGLGEAFFAARTVETYIHEALAPLLIESNMIEPERFSRAATSYLGFQGAGAETRARAALDLALWDLVGKRSELPLAEVLGGPVRRDIAVYNTCAGPGYVSKNAEQASSNWGLDHESPFEDLAAFLNDPARLAQDLLADGLHAMKIWPFDQAAERTHGLHIDQADLRAGVDIVGKIRDAVGDEMNIMIELHGLWHRAPATRIIDALAEYDIGWIEDPLRSDAVAALAALRRDVDTPIAIGETTVGRRGLLPLLQASALDIATVDVQWTGGVTEARKTASLADAFAVPFAPHDCTGPATLAACLHLVMSQPNGLVQETVRAFMHTWYSEFSEGLPTVENGRISLPTGHGHGVTLRPDLFDRPDVERTVFRP